MHIFVTGSTGFVGSNFIEELKGRLKSTDKVYLMTRKVYHYDDSRFVSIKGDLESIGDNSEFKKAILECEYVYHIAANATFGNKEDYEKTNYKPTQNIVDILKKSKKLKNFIFISTIGAVDRSKSDNCKNPLNKDSIPSPKSKYGESKLKSERYIQESNISYTIIRPTWVYGKNMRSKSHINLFVTMVYQKSIITRINFPGKVSLIHVKDLAKSLVNCIDNKKVIGKTYFAETESKSMGDIFNIIHKKVFNKNASQIPILSFRGIVGKVHPAMPVPASNLFVDYLCAVDDDFKKDLLKKAGSTRPIMFEDGVDDVISTNVLASGYWVITGANSGIGLALARKLKAQKKNLILIDKDIGLISKEFHSNISESSAGSSDQKSVIIKADLSKFEEIEKAVEHINSYPIYCLVNNAGIGYRKSFQEINLEEIQKIIAVNIKAHLFITKLLLGKLKKEGSVIVNIASSVAYNPLPNMLMYSSTKAFISNWSESLTYELKDTNKVITFSPSGTNTKFQENSGVKKEKEGKGLMTPEQVADKIISAVKHNKSVVILGLKTKILLMIATILPRKINILFWGKLFEKMR